MKEITVKEELAEAIYYDEPFLAHTLYYALQKGYVQEDDPISKLPTDMDYKAITKMRDDNWLQMCTIKLFTIPLNQDRYAIYLARDEDDVRAKHFKIYGWLAQRVIDASHRMDASLYWNDTGVSKTFREMKREALEFPSYVGEVGRN